MSPCPPIHTVPRPSIYTISVTTLPPVEVVCESHHPCWRRVWTAGPPPASRSPRGEESARAWRRPSCRTRKEDSYFCHVNFKSELSSVPEGTVLASRRRFPLVHCSLTTYILLPFVESHEDGDILHLAREMTEVSTSLTTFLLVLPQELANLVVGHLYL